MDIKDQYKAITLSAIESIQNRKIKDKIHPTHSLRGEIKTLIDNGVQKVLDEMVEEGELEGGNTMNHYFYKIK